MDTQTVSSMIATLGLPTALLLLIAYAAWKGSGWIGSKVILPVVAEAISLLRGLREGIETLKQQADDIRQVRVSQDRIERHLIPDPEKKP